MKVRFISVVCFFSVFASLIAATAFRNWDNPEKHLVNYHNSGQYYQDISVVIKEATYYLQFRLTQNERSHNRKKLAIVMDIDETALSNYQPLERVAFHVTPELLKKIESSHNGPAIPYTLALYNYAKDHGVDIFFITGRKKNITKHTINNLKHAGYHEWKNISFNPSSHIVNTTHYRVVERHKIQKQGYDIIMNIGNRKATLAGGHSDMIFKLPNPFYELS